MHYRIDPMKEFEGLRFSLMLCYNAELASCIIYTKGTQQFDRRALMYLSQSGEFK
jgi:hypothetical protein